MGVTLSRIDRLRADTCLSIPMDVNNTIGLKFLEFGLAGHIYGQLGIVHLNFGKIDSGKNFFVVLRIVLNLVQLHRVCQDNLYRLVI